MTEDRYLDSSRFLRELEEANRPGGTLDDEAVLEELAKAVKHCTAQEKYHSTAANNYMLARIAYFEEAHRRTVLSKSEVARMGKVAQMGASLPRNRGFKSWCHDAGVNYAYAVQLVGVSRTPDPLAALVTMREKIAKNARELGRKIRADERWVSAEVGLPTGAGATSRDPLRRALLEYYKLSPVRRAEFLRRIGYSDLDPTAGMQEWLAANPIRMAAE